MDSHTGMGDCSDRSGPSRVRQILLACVIALGATWCFSRIDLNLAEEAMHQRWGAPGLAKFQVWRNLVTDPVKPSELAQLKRVNDFFNRHIEFAEDTVVWGQRDYWASPMETLGQGRGDCEDYAFAKLFTLRVLGVAPEKLRLIYVQARTVTAGSAFLSAHMVLAYYPSADAEPLIMDNLVADIRPASSRPDLAPVFSFSDMGVYKRTQNNSEERVGGAMLLSRWEGLMKKVNAEGLL